MANRTSWLFQTVLAPWHDRRAKSITDPVQRLRYLRKTMGTPESTSSGTYIHQKRLRQARWILALLLVAGALMTPRWLSNEVQAGSPRVLVVNGFDPKVPRESAEEVPHIWMVESRAGEEWYSNGLRIDTAFTTGNTPRKPIVLERKTMKQKDFKGFAGIVFHTTESLMAPFEEGSNSTLRVASRGVLQFVQSQRCYHYVIDRFGRVHRVVKEDDTAWHSGDSLWGDEESYYVGLNDTFLGIALESATKAGNDTADTVTPAQINAARLLTALLRSRYRISPWNCVTHAQVSLNPAYFLIGLHTDFAANFPFAEIGLPDNYGRNYPSITEFGFSYNDVFLKATGTRMLTGLALSEDKLRRDAASKGLALERHRAQLQEKYKSAMAAVTVSSDAAEGKDKEKK